jgi:hypothetical protein
MCVYNRPCGVWTDRCDDKSTQRAHTNTRVNTACGARKASHTLACAQRREMWHAHLSSQRLYSPTDRDILLVLNVLIKVIRVPLRPKVGCDQGLANETLALTCIQCVCVHVLRGLVCGWCALSVHGSPRFCVCVWAHAVALKSAQGPLGHRPPSRDASLGLLSLGTHTRL